MTLSIIVPTYKEVENIPFLVERIAKVLDPAQWSVELLLMDDDSRDGSDELVGRMGLPWVKLVTRTSNRGLSPAVLDGLRRATGEYLVVMDADLSHPPEVVPKLIDELERGADFVLGSRYVSGGTTDDDWGLFRWANSRVATLLARPLTHLKDPMSGFFALRRETFMAGHDYNPIGYKIALELIVKCGCVKQVEIPIHFADRQLGESKLTFKEQLKYIQHVRRLMIYKYGTWSHLVQFLTVGGLGAVINVVIITAMTRLGYSEHLSVAIGILISFVCNFVLNRRFTFSYARADSIIRQLVGFTSACAVGALINYSVTVSLYSPEGPIRSLQLAAVVGILAGALINFAFNRYFVFKFKHVRPKSADRPASELQNQRSKFK